LLYFTFYFEFFLSILFFFFFVFFFFFSSRRRHTRCYRDWSSDVCSSDLYRACDPARYWSRPLRADVPRQPRLATPVFLSATCRRSEERRVGKECRSRWERDQ